MRIITSSAQGEKGNAILRDKMMYVWSDTTKTGFLYKVDELKDITPLPKNQEKGLMDGFNKESFLAEMEKYKDSCKVENLSDDLFVIPKDVKFQDMSFFQKQMIQQQLQLPEGSTQQDIEKYL